MIVSLLLLAAATTGSPSIEGIFLQYGLIGAIALILGIFARRAIASTEARAQRLEEDNRRLYQMMAEQMVPALTKATEAVVDATAIMAEIKHRADIETAIAEAARRRRSG
jgi:hypothetical protein